MSVIQAQTSARELRFVRCDDEGRLTTNLEATIDDVTIKGETAGGVKTPVLVQTDGKLETMCFGKTGAGADKELLVEANGSFVLGGGSVKTAISSVDGSTQSIQVDSTGALIVRTDNSNDSIRITGLNSAGANKGIGVEDTDGGILSAGKVVVATPTHADGTRQLLRLNASGELMVNDSSGGGGGSASNLYNKGGSEETLSVLAPVGPATSAVTPAVTIYDMSSYKGIAINVVTTSATYFDISVGVEFSNSATFLTTLGAAYSDIQTFNAATDVSGNPVAGQYVANVLMTPEFNSQQPQARYARVSFNHNNNTGSNISVTINAIQMPF